MEESCQTDMKKHWLGWCALSSAVAKSSDHGYSRGGLSLSDLCPVSSGPLSLTPSHLLQYFTAPKALGPMLTLCDLHVPQMGWVIRTI